MIQPPPWKKTTVAPVGFSGQYTRTGILPAGPGMSCSSIVGDLHQHRRVVPGADLDAALPGLLSGGVLEQWGFAVVLHGLQHPGDIGVDHGVLLWVGVDE